VRGLEDDVQEALLKYAYDACVRERKAQEAGTPGIRASLFYDACVIALLRSLRFERSDGLP
jgi:hypothetical protein